MRVVLVRHGETLTNRERLALGRADPPLSDLGLRQAGATARALAARGAYEAVYTSPLLRARQTADAIGALLGLTPLVEGDLAEMDIGEMEGLDAGEMRQRFPDFMRAWAGDRAGDLPMPGGESLTQVQDRAWSFINALRERHAADAGVVAISHNFVIRTIVCRALGMPLSAFRRFQQDLASWTTMDFRGQRTMLAALNETCHLAGLAAGPDWGDVPRPR